MRELRAASAGNESRPQLRALAQEFPGVLRELDSMTTEEIERRLAACERVANSGTADAEPALEPWMEWVARYHELVLESLANRRRAGKPVSARPRARLNDLVLEQLSRELGVSTHQLAATLFPPRTRRR
jgi:hypothetical protein